MVAGHAHIDSYKLLEDGSFLTHALLAQLCLHS